MAKVEMHPEFRGWYSRLKIQLEDSTLNARWAAVDEFASQSEHADIIGLLSIVFGLNKIKADPTVIERFVDKIKEYDDSFIGHGAEVEIRLLAACTLVAVMGKGDVKAAWSALATLTSHFDGLRTLLKLPIGLPQIARETLAQLSLKASLRPRFVPAKVVQPKAIATPEALDPASVTKMITTAVGQAVALATSLADRAGSGNLDSGISGFSA